MKCIEILTLEGTFKLRKIFTSRSQIPNEVFSEFGHTDVELNTRIEAVPKNLDYQPLVDKLNQVISADVMKGCLGREGDKFGTLEDDHMRITGQRVHKEHLSSASGKMYSKAGAKSAKGPKETVVSGFGAASSTGSDAFEANTFLNK